MLRFKKSKCQRADSVLLKALCPPKISIYEVDFSTMRQAHFWEASTSGAGPGFLNVKNSHLLFLLPFSIMGKDAIAVNPCGVCGIPWPVKVYAAFMYSMNWAQVLLPTAGDFFQGHPIKMKVWSLTETAVSGYGPTDVLDGSVF